MKYLKFRKNKKNWTGKEAGQLFFMGLEEQAAYAKGEKDASEPPEITGELLAKAENAVPQDTQERFTYAVYRALYYAIVNFGNENRKELFNLDNATSNLNAQLEKLITRERILANLEHEPLIMTAADYQEKKNEALQALRSRKISVYEAFFVILTAASMGKKNTPQAIIDALEELKRTPANTSTLARLCRGEQETDTETACEREKIDELLFYGTLREYIETETGAKLTCTDAELEEAVNHIFNGKSEESRNADIAIIEEAVYRCTCIQQRQTKSEVPENVTLYDILPQIIREAGISARRNREKSYFEEIKQALPTLYRAIIDCIRATPQARKLHEEEFYTDFATAGELEAADVPGFNLEEDAEHAELGQFYEKGLIKGDYSDIMRAISGGVAIHEGEYTRNNPLKGTANPLEEAGERETIEYYEDTIHKVIGHICAFNEALDIIATAFDVPQATAAKINIELMGIEHYNKGIYYINARLTGSEENRKRKREKLKEIFRPIDTRRSDPTKEQVKEAYKSLEKMSRSYETGYQILALRALVNALYR